MDTTDPLRGDRPIAAPEQDHLGLADFAGRLATALTSQAAADGFVVGIEGRWGAGKSSLLGLTLNQLKERPEAVAVVEFRPWLVGDRDQLLTTLFDDLAKTIAAVEHASGDATRVTTRAARDVAEQARRFARHLGPWGKLAGLAGTAIPMAGVFGHVLGALAEAAGQDAGGPALATQKDDLARALRDLGRRIVVTVDDVDRLEPKEVAEVLRLVRSVADFPNVVYVLCYEGDALAKSIERGTGVTDGRAYLEKIVQTEIGVPRPASFALRRWFSRELATFATCEGEAGQRLAHVIDTAGGRGFDTARTVVRVLDSLRIYWPALADGVDLADLVWLRILAVTAPNTHRWIEEYVDANAAIAIERASVGGHERVKVGCRLDQALATDGLEWETVQFDFHAHLPGIGYGKAEAEKDGRIFASTPGYAQPAAVRDRRLASPDHGRLYFALAAAPGTIRFEDVRELLLAGRRSADEVADMLLAWDAERGDGSVGKAERMLDHLAHASYDSLARTDPGNLVLGVALAADGLADGREDEWGSPRSWFLFKSLLRTVRAGVPAERWTGVMRDLFGGAMPIGLLTYLFRDQTFAHGVHGERPDPQERLTTMAEFNDMRDAMLARYSALRLDAVMAHPWRTSMLYAWSQGGGRAGLVHEIAGRAQDHAWVPKFLHAILSASRSSDGEHPSLSIDALGNFFDDVPATLETVVALADAGDEAAEVVVAAVDRSMGFASSETLVEWLKRIRAPADDGVAEDPGRS